LERNAFALRPAREAAPLRARRTLVSLCIEKQTVSIARATGQWPVQHWPLAGGHY